jgi:hypothetical protein
MYRVSRLCCLVVSSISWFFHILLPAYRYLGSSFPVFGRHGAHYLLVLVLTFVLAFCRHLYSCREGLILVIVLWLLIC